MEPSKSRPDISPLVARLLSAYHAGATRYAVDEIRKLLSGSASLSPREREALERLESVLVVMGNPDTTKLDDD